VRAAANKNIYLKRLFFISGSKTPQFFLGFFLMRQKKSQPLKKKCGVFFLLRKKQPLTALSGSAILLAAHWRPACGRSASSYSQ